MATGTCSEARATPIRAATTRPLSRLRAAFTLFEIAISAALVAGAATVVFMVIPIGLRAQHQARFQLYAGCKVLEMIDTFANHDHTYSSHQLEAERLGQNTMPMKWPVDLDRMMNGKQLGLLPLPNEIATRLDSDGDEIAGILQDGGRLYYASPAAYEVGYHIRSGGHNAGTPDTLATERVPPPEAQSILFAVVGYAQQNALPNHPCLAWPYGAYYPSLPASGNSSHSWWAGPWEYYSIHNENSLGLDPLALADFKKLCDLCPSWNYTGMNNLATKAAYTQNLPLIRDYIKTAQDLLTKLGVPMTGAPPYLLPRPPADLTSFSKPWSRSNPDIFPPPTWVSAIRWLAVGAVMRTGWWTVTKEALLPEDTAYALALQECTMLWARRYAATNPYDWGAPRPLNRCSAWDFPLLQYDLTTPAHAVGDNVLDAAGRPDLTYKILAPVLPTNHGSGYAMYGDIYPQYSGDGRYPTVNRSHIAASWRRDPADPANIDAAKFNLAAAFAAAERCRQIVCWSADWKAYEDFETAPSGPHDASSVFCDSRGMYVDNEIVQHPADLTLCWEDITRTTLVPPQNGGNPFDGANIARRNQASYRQTLFGVWGVDRNGNRSWDRGPLPTSARMRALPIGRWNYYDRRLISALRN